MTGANQGSSLQIANDLIKHYFQVARRRPLPPVLARTLPHLPQPVESGTFAVVCRGRFAVV